MNNKQRKNCVFADKVSGVQCSALSEYVCNEKKCSFFKSKDEYYLDSDRFPVRKEGGLK